jgi:hypothetical protein
MPPLRVKGPMACIHCGFDDVSDGANFRKEERLSYRSFPRPEDLPEWEDWDDERELSSHETVLVCVSCNAVNIVLGRAT